MTKSKSKSSLAQALAQKNTPLPRRERTPVGVFVPVSCGDDKPGGNGVS